jgi:lysophospholipase L1-like esterase
MMGSDPSSTEQLIAGGWGYVLLDTSSIQADNGAGLMNGIIGLTNKGQPRKPENWGALRAWGWGASRALDYLETDRSADARRIGIEGVSRYGKAALVTMAFDTRFAAALVGSSGEGGAKPHRRDFGEQVENLTGSGEYQWMAGNFLKYGAAQAPFGSMNASKLPVDSNELIALCAPRLTFISYGVPAMGDAAWLDQQGTNNVGDLSARGGADARADDITRGVQAIVHLIREKAPAATNIVMGIFPRNDNMAFAPLIDRINRNLSEFADGQKIRYLNINDKLTNSDGRLLDGMMDAHDKLHPTLKAYQAWAEALKPVLTELLGPPAALDHAPPPTGDSAAGH